MRFLLVVFLIGIFFSCESNQEGNKQEEIQESDSIKNTQSEAALKRDSLSVFDYFYPVTDEPYIYAFQDKFNPISERFFRYVTMEKDGDDLFVIEMYNDALRIFEGFTLDRSSNFKIIDHMKVDRKGLKRKSNMLKTQYFPNDFNDQSVFIVDFPSHLDSVIMVYESRKNIIATGVEIQIMGKKVNTIKLIDSVRVHMVNTYTQKTSTQVAPIYRYYAEGKGQVRFEGVDTDVQYNLVKILPDSWWSEYAQ